MAQVKDITSIADREKRLRAERVNILCAKDCIMNRAAFKTGKDFTAAFLSAAKSAGFSS
jgi:5-methylthioribose kinase